MGLVVKDISFPQNSNVIIGQSHFIKTVDDLYRVLAESGAVEFGIAFCEASGDRLVRWDGNSQEAIEAAQRIAMDVGAGHMFVVVLTKGFPINVLNRIKQVSEVTTIHVATANPLKVVLYEEAEQRAILGFMDGMKPLGIENEKHQEERRAFLKKIGYDR